MATGITWTDETWNPVVGCSKISPGCANCYAAELARSTKMQKFPQYVSSAQWDGTIAEVESALDKPLRMRHPKKIFVGSMTDLFHENISDEYRDRIFAVIAGAHWHTFQVLTKRPDNALRYFNRFNLEQRIKDASHGLVCKPELPLKNVWVGVTAENQAMANLRIPFLLQIPAAIRWVSIEPILEEVAIAGGIDWAVVGGESGTGFREIPVVSIHRTISGLLKQKIPVWVKQDSKYRSGQQGRIANSFWQIKQFPSFQ